MLTLKGFCLLTLSLGICDAMLSLCDTPSGYLEVREGKQNNTFTCSGQVSGLTVQWQLEYKSMIYLGTCNPDTTCTSNFVSTFNLQRTADTASLIVDETETPQKDVFYTTSVLCQAFSESKKIDETRCPLDLISPPETSSCSLQITNTTWKLTGQCDVSKVRSARGRYYCLLYQNSQRFPSTTQLVGRFNMSAAPTPGTNYSSATCQINTFLPPEGNYNYSVVIFPGQVQISPFFSGSTEISRPSQIPVHNCPLYVPESLALRCYCKANDLGAPQGYVVWNGLNSPELQIDSVNRTISGMNFTCSLMWNNTVLKTVTYSPIVNYSSSVLSFKMDEKKDSAVTVMEKTYVSVICKADGSPMSSILLFKENDSQDPEVIRTVTNAHELQHNLSVDGCEAAGIYTCQSTNSIGQDEQHILLTVYCAPRRRFQHSIDLPSTAFDGETAMLQFEMIAYPTVRVQSVVFNSSSLNGSFIKDVVLKDSVKSNCIARNVFLVTCTVFLTNKSAFTAGVYDMTFWNGLGSLSLTYELKEGTASGGSKPDNASSVAGEVIGGALVLALIIGVFIVILRQYRKKDKTSALNPMESTDMNDTQKGSENLYDLLQQEDVNSPSVYQTLGGRHGTSKDPADHDGKSSVYEDPVDTQPPKHVTATHQRDTTSQKDTCL